MPPKRLEPWLRSKLDTGGIRGLRWVDRSRQIWAMPWKDNKETEVGDPDAVMLTEMARHLYKYKGDIPTNKEISEWKRKFRCSLTSLKGVKELKEYHYLDGETKTLFKVYRFTSADEQSASVHLANMNTSNTIRNFHGNLKRAAPAEKNSMLFSGHTTTKRQRLNPSPHTCDPCYTPAVVVGLSGSRISPHQLTPSSSRDYFMDGPADTRGNAENQNTNITGQQVMMNATSNSAFFTHSCQNNVPQTSIIVPSSYESAIMDDDDDLWCSDDDMTGMATNETSETVPLTTIIESSVPAISSKVAPGCQTSSSTVLCSSAAPKIISSEGALSSFTNHLQSTTSKMCFPEAQPPCPIPPPITSCVTPPRTYFEGITPQCTASSSNLSSLELLLDEICSQDMISQFTTSSSEISPINAPQGVRPQNTVSLEENALCDAPDDTNLLSFSLELQYPFNSMAETEKKVDDTKLSCNNPEPSKDNAPQGTEFQNTVSYEETSLMDAPGGTTLLDIPLGPKNAELQYPSHSLAVTEKKVDDISMTLSSTKPEPSKDNAPQGIETQNTASYEEPSLMEAPGGTTLLDISIVPKNAELQYSSDSLKGAEKKADDMKLSLNESKPSIDDATMAISIHYFGNRVTETPIKNKGIRLCHVPNDDWRDSIKTCKDPEQYGPCNFPLLEFPSVKSCLALTPEQQGVVKKVLERLKRGISFSLEGSDIYACRHSNAVAFYRPPENEHFQKMERQQKVKAFDLCKILTSFGVQESLKSSRSFVRFSFGTEDPNTASQQAAVEVDVYNMAFYRAQSLSVEGGSQCADVLCSMSDGFDNLLQIEQQLLDESWNIFYTKTSSLGSLPTGASTQCMVR